MKRVTQILIFPIAAIMLFACEGMNNESTKDDAAMADTLLAGSYMVNTANSVVMWSGDMLAIGGVSMYGHEGTLNVAKGNLEFANGMISGGTVVVDMKTISPTDENFNPEEGKGKPELVGHLSSPDFFAIDSFPEAIFVVTGMEDDKVMGNLTIRGITKPETIEDFTLEETDGGVKATGTMVFDRQEFNVKFSMANAMDVRDKVLSDDIKLKFELSAKEENMVGETM